MAYVLHATQWVYTVRTNAVAFLDLRRRLNVDDLTIRIEASTNDIVWAWRIGDQWHEATTANDGPEVTVATIQAIIRLTE